MRAFSCDGIPAVFLLLIRPSAFVAEATRIDLQVLAAKQSADSLVRIAYTSKVECGRHLLNQLHTWRESRADIDKHAGRRADHVVEDGLGGDDAAGEGIVADELVYHDAGHDCFVSAPCCKARCSAVAVVGKDYVAAITPEDCVGSLPFREPSYTPDAVPLPCAVATLSSQLRSEINRRRIDE